MGKKHPLDIFRTTHGGFDSATRDRRTLAGKVVASTPRPGPGEPEPGAERAETARPERTAPLISAARAAAAARAQQRFDEARVHSSAASAAAPPRSPARVAARPAGQRAAGRPAAVNRFLLLGALGIVGAFAIYLVGMNTSGLSLKSAMGGGSYAVVAATWEGTPQGKAAAEGCRDVLRESGFPDVRVLGYPSAKAGEFKSFDLLVGSAGSKSELDELLGQVAALRNTRGEAAFASARIVPAPVVAAR